MALTNRDRRVYDLLPADGTSMMEADWEGEALRMRVSPDRDSFRSSVALLFYDRRVVTRLPVILNEGTELYCGAFFYKRVG